MVHRDNESNERASVLQTVQKLIAFPRKLLKFSFDIISHIDFSLFAFLCLFGRKP